MLSSSSSTCPAACSTWNTQPARLKALQLKHVLSRAQLFGCPKQQQTRSLLLPAAAAVQQDTSAPVRQAATDASGSINAAATQQQKQQRKPDGSRAKQQTLDYTVLAACCHELAGSWVPSKVEEVRKLAGPTAMVMMGVLLILSVLV
jgi:hypothetical protein